MPLELTPKKAAIQFLEKADDSISFEEIIYELHVLQKIDRGLTDIQEGRTIMHDEVKEEF